MRMPLSGIFIKDVSFVEKEKLAEVQFLKKKGYFRIKLITIPLVQTFPLSHI